VRDAPVTGQTHLNFLEFRSQNNFQWIAEGPDTPNGTVLSFRPERLPERLPRALLEEVRATPAHCFDSFRANGDL
jgi:hypothetical protein